MLGNEKVNDFGFYLDLNFFNLTDDFTKWKNTEIIDAGKEIGYTVNRNGDIIIARSIKIHYSKSGTHGVPFSGGWKK